MRFCALHVVCPLVLQLVLLEKNNDEPNVQEKRGDHYGVHRRTVL